MSYKLSKVWRVDVWQNYNQKTDLHVEPQKSVIILPEDTDTETIQKVLENNTAVDVVDVIVGNKVIAENEPLETAQAPDDLGNFQISD